jgi:CTP:molybdopterin cytidylyltransferase MocA
MNFILLAAGQGKRMGVNKALMSFKGEPWILTQLRQIADVELQNITIVTNPDSEASLEKILAEFKAKVRLTSNPHPEKGPFSSLQLAIAMTPEDASFVCPIDVPLKSTSLKKLRQTWLQHGHLEALIPSYNERKGHPVILSADLQRKLLNLSQDNPEARLDFALKALPENKKRILPLEDPYITFNLNTPEDLTALLTSPI